MRRSGAHSNGGRLGGNRNRYQCRWRSHPESASFYLLAKHRLWGTGVIAIGCVAAVCHWLAEPIPGLGVALPVFAPP